MGASKRHGEVVFLLETRIRGTHIDGEIFSERGGPVYLLYICRLYTTSNIHDMNIYIYIYSIFYIYTHTCVFTLCPNKRRSTSGVESNQKLFAALFCFNVFLVSSANHSSRTVYDTWPYSIAVSTYLVSI